MPAVPVHFLPSAGMKTGNTFRKVQAYGELLNAEIKPPFVRKTVNGA